MSPPFVFHRLTSAYPNEEAQVRASGQLWGKAPRMVAGNGPPCVKAFVGRLPEGAKGYTFETEVEPTRRRNFVGDAGAVWEFGNPGVFDVGGMDGFVGIAVKVLDV